jgi:predicted GH43/DUF377 family glycosyl hydrolase
MVMRNSVLTLAIVMTAGSSLAQQPKGWELGPWTRMATEPIIRPDTTAVFHDPITGKPVHWEGLHTFNPAAVVRHRKVYVLYRAEDDSGAMAIGQHVSRLGLAVSEDGIHFQQMPEPVFYAAHDAQLKREQNGGTEDPRLVESPDGTYVLTYTQWSRTTGMYAVGIATSRDLKTWIKHGPAFAGASNGAYDNFKYKSAGILTQRKGEKLIAAKVNGKFWMYWGEITVRLATSDDLIHWKPVETTPGKPLGLLEKRPGLSDSAFPETGPPPLLTQRGIVLLYNGKNAAGVEGDPLLKPAAYSVQEALFDGTNPAKLLARTERPVLEPELPFEQSGQFAAGTTFAEGLVWFKKSWWLYYGCADSFVSVANAPSK